MTPGRLLYVAFHQPREWLEAFWDRARQSARDGRMQIAAQNLIPLRLAAAHAGLPPIRFLTGAAFAHQTAFCAYSLCRTCKTSFRFEFFDDGSLRESDKGNLLRLFPGSHVVPVADCEERVARRLPPDRYPTLSAMRGYSVLMRKLVDLHAGLSGPNLYLDSDMLFFSRPQALEDWLRLPSAPLYMEEGSDAYVDRSQALDRTFGTPITRGVNSGIVAIDDSAIDWDRLEQLASALSPAQRKHKWAEQTLTAILMKELKGTPLDRKAYEVCSNRSEVYASRGCLRHYVFKAKMPYLHAEWKRCIAQITAQ